MKSLILSLFVGTLVALSTAAEAKTAKAVGKAKAKRVSELSTDVKFDDSVLHGEYQTPDEALAKVENEKGLRDLIGARKHFKDRLAEAAEQQ